MVRRVAYVHCEVFWCFIDSLSMITSCYSNQQKAKTGNSNSTARICCRMMEISIRRSLGAWESKDPFSVGSGALFIGVGGWDRAQISKDFFWHVSGPTRPTSESFKSICDRYEVISIDQDDVQSSWNLVETLLGMQAISCENFIAFGSVDFEI